VFTFVVLGSVSSVPSQEIRAGKNVFEVTCFVSSGMQFFHMSHRTFLQCFDAVGWAAGRASSLYKTEWWGAGMVICLERGADLHTPQLMLLPLTVSCFNKIQIGFTFLVPAHLGSPGKWPLNVCVLGGCKA